MPEHFNLPWHLAIEAGVFADHGVEVRWEDQPGGTGQMVAAVAAGDLDLIVALTEGVVRAIADGLAAKVVSTYVTTPLQWGIHVAAASPHHSEGDLAGGRFAISRYGSGSHLMAYVLAERLGWTLGDDSFVVVRDLPGALAALTAGEAEIFLWDRFMTHPHVTDGTLRRVGVQPTPWPAFVIAAHTDIDPLMVASVATTIGMAAPGFPDRPDAVDLVVDRYGLDRTVAREWLASTAWGGPEPVDQTLLDEVLATLTRLGAR